ncbi:MAG: amidophosphoribosyltransferase [Spirochaetales bacterium]|nr:amidophosphoribosyltransferase [Spirochaetales bacterium]
MGGFFGVASNEDCVTDLFYGTDYHSHLGTMRGGLAVVNLKNKISRVIHNITNAQFRSKFTDELDLLYGNKGIGVISDYEDQPLVIASHLGVYAIVTVGVVVNIDALEKKAYKNRITHFSEMGSGELNPTEVISTLINQGESFEEGLKIAQEAIEGSCSILILTGKGIFAARDKLGRTPVIVGKKENACAVTFETSAFYNLGYSTEYYLGPGEVIFVTEHGYKTVVPAREKMRICTFLWVYYGYPSSNYENINVEIVRNRCGAALAKREKEDIDVVGGIPDSATGHAIGFANEARLRYGRPFVKYTPTWPRSFMPQAQKTRDLVATMKLLPVKELIENKSLLFCEDSIVRGTQLRFTIKRLFESGAKAIHMRPACPPLVYGCKFLNFSRSRSELDLAARKAIKQLEGKDDAHLEEYANPDSDKHQKMVEIIKEELGLTSLKYQRLDDMVAAVGLPKEKLCTYCWDGVG